MTQYRKNPDDISNYFDAILRGIGKRGSSFADIDRLDHDPSRKSATVYSHDGDGDRILIQEFKRDGEPLSFGQKLALRGLASKPHITVWLVRKREDGRIGFAVFGSGQRAESVITTEEYRARFREWWYGRGDIPAPNTSRAPLDGDGGDLTAQDLRWV